MKSRIDSDFRAAFACLPAAVRQQARTAYRLFIANPNHPSLHFKSIAPSVYSVRIGIHYRALGVRVKNDEIVWFWIGSHAEYDKLIKQL
ncbi:hypothetical protein [Candidatus Oscillochloris fontis]|uniref:ParE family toxin-like protein n=1 Tax=Candidatus Oscillochloris fontis TaxID=2496868 RepID=UPI00101DD278